MSTIVKLKKPKKIDTFLYQHFKRTDNVLVQPVEKLIYDENSSVRFNTIKRLETELKWIKLLQSASPVGYNDNIYQEGNISKMPDFDVFALLEIQKRKRRSHGKRQKGNDKRKRCAAQKSGTSNYNLSSKLRGNTVDMQCFLFLIPFPLRSYAFWILRLIGFMIGITKCMRLHF